MNEPQWQYGQYVSTDRQAEQMAAVVMRSMGHPDARETPVGPDGGVDVRASGALAQVKFRGAQTGRSDIQRLVGARGRDTHLALLFFTATGYSTHAVEYAADMDVALFVFDPLGRLTPHSPAAKAALAQTQTAPAEAQQPAAPSAFEIWWRRYWLEAITVFSWLSVPMLTVGKLQGEEDTGWAEIALAFSVAVAGTLAWRYRHRHDLGPNFSKRNDPPGDGASTEG